MTSRVRTQLAIALWIVFAFVAFNALFDFLVVRAGRDYLHAAAIADRDGHQRLLLADWMRPAVKRAFAYASILGFAILASGFIGFIVARRGQSRRT
jgi:hypothetical protein